MTHFYYTQVDAWDPSLGYGTVRLGTVKRDGTVRGFSRKSFKFLRTDLTKTRE